MKVPVPDVIEPVDSLGHVHFVGIGGAALSGIARIMSSRGLVVSGSDAKDSPMLETLRGLGVECFVGHRAEQIEGADTLVVSTAIRADNPEVGAAYERLLRVWPRSAALQSLLQGRTTIAISGTHGKTSTTAMLTTALIEVGADPSYAIGSTLNASGVNAHNGTGTVFVAEADESDGAFLVYTPQGVVVTNVEADHLDNWGTAEAYSAAFEQFLSGLPAGGFAVCCVDDPGARRLAEFGHGLPIDVVTVGLAEDTELRAVDLHFVGTSSTFTVLRVGQSLGTVQLQVPGEHNVINALGALAAGLQLGFDFTELATGLGQFRGTGRRMEFKGEFAGVRVYDSYAHHPTEIAGDLAAARVAAGSGRVVVAYQPHMYSRTRIFGRQMGVELGRADEVVVMDVYAAREDPEPGISGATVADAVPLSAARVVYEPAFERVVDRLLERARPGDLVLTLGAGDVTELAPELLKRLAEKAGKS